METIKFKSYIYLPYIYQQENILVGTRMRTACLYRPYLLHQPLDISIGGRKSWSDQVWTGHQR